MPKKPAKGKKKEKVKEKEKEKEKLPLQIKIPENEITLQKLSLQKIHIDKRVI